MEMGFPRRDRGHNSVDRRIDPVHCLCLSLRKLQQDLRLVERASGPADLDVAVSVRRAVWSRG